MTECSIIIPAYNRPRYLKRILSYYNDYQFASNIIVADCSSDENKLLNGKTISALSGINISHISNYPSKIYMYHKLADALTNVNTKYCVLCADDDFITPNGIYQSIDFLEKNPDFTVAHGHYISFYLRSDGIGRGQFYWEPTHSRESITFPDPKKRLTYHLSYYSAPTLYAVHRTDMLRMVFNETIKFADDYRFGELLPSMLILIYGKLKCLNVFYAAREIWPGQSSRTDKTMRDFIEDGTYSEKHAMFRDCLAAHLSKEGQLAIEESNKLIDNAMSLYMKGYSPNKKQTLLRKISDSLDYLNLPDWMDERIRAL